MEAGMGHKLDCSGCKLKLMLPNSVFFIPAGVVTYGPGPDDGCSERRTEEPGGRGEAGSLPYPVENHNPHKCGRAQLGKLQLEKTKNVGKEIVAREARTRVGESSADHSLPYSWVRHDSFTGKEGLPFDHCTRSNQRGEFSLLNKRLAEETTKVIVHLPWIRSCDSGRSKFAGCHSILAKVVW